MPDRPIDPQWIQDLSERLYERPLGEDDAAAVAGLLNALHADMQAFRELAVDEADEPATVYAAVEASP